MSNHICAGCGRCNLSEREFDRTPTGRRKKRCKWCCKYMPTWVPSRVNVEMSVLGRGR